MTRHEALSGGLLREDSNQVSVSFSVTLVFGGLKKQFLSYYYKNI